MTAFSIARFFASEKQAEFPNVDPLIQENTNGAADDTQNEDTTKRLLSILLARMLLPRSPGPMVFLGSTANQVLARQTMINCAAANGDPM